MQLDWLNENEQRAYPFVVGSPAGGYLKGIVDALFFLGTDFSYDLNDETTQIRLSTVARSGVDWVLTFQHFQNNSLVSTSPDIVFRFGIGTLRHTLITTTTPGMTRAALVIGDPSAFSAASPGAVLEDRVVVMAPQSLQSVTVYNAERRKSYKPFFVSTPGNSAATDYALAKAAAGPFIPNIVLRPGVTILSDVISIENGNNTEVTADLAAHEVTIRFGVGLGKGVTCTTLTELGVVHHSYTGQGALQSLNDLYPADGDLAFVVGSKMKSVSIPEQNLIQIETETPISGSDCVTTGVQP